jgi:hypothetical protein
MQVISPTLQLARLMSPLGWYYYILNYASLTNRMIGCQRLFTYTCCTSTHNGLISSDVSIHLYFLPLPPIVFWLDSCTFWNEHVRKNKRCLWHICLFLFLSMKFIDKEFVILNIQIRSLIAMLETIHWSCHYGHARAGDMLSGCI